MAKHSVDPPDLSTIGGRLRWAREQRRFTSARAAASEFGWNENTYKSHETGVRGAKGFKTEYVEKYCRAYRIEPTWLMTGKGAAIAGAAEAEWSRMTPAERDKALRLLKAAG